jgi:hypothetical protein
VNRPHSPLLDRLAILLSGLCLLHCLLGALLLSGLVVAGGMLSHDVHVVGLALALPLAAVALWRGVRVHGRLGVLLTGACGILLMAASVFAVHAGDLEMALSVSGVVVLALAHVWNLRAVRR